MQTIGPSADLHLCLDNMDTINYVNGGAGYEGAFFKKVAESSPVYTSCFTSDVGIVFAEHMN